ncbi:hypothetical protein ACH5RR_011788 [Cinchona calisaya]|uniref:Uncharacterized protein n=1 Tax=Cinchona calisaya TaxID=153742 RepID=A0ABD3A9I7_9GENT
MEALHFDNAKSEKSTSILPYTHFKSIAKLFRIVELCLGLVFLSWTYTRLPFAVKISGEYLRHLVTVILSPLFIFLLCNFLVLTLLFKSGRILSGPQSPALIISETDLYEEFVEISDNCMNFMNLISPPEVVEFEDKQTIFEVSKTFKVQKFSDASGVAEAVTDKPSEMKAYSTSQSENFDLKMEFFDEEDNSSRGKLIRSETEKCRKVANPGEIPAETLYIFDELSNEEFQQAIDAFIAKQIKFHREEKLAIVLHSHS